MGPAKRFRGGGRAGHRGGGRGRGRGRGGSRGGRSQPQPPRFHDQRLDDDEGDSETDAKLQPDEEPSDVDDVSSDEDEEQTAPVTRPYLALLQSLTESSGPSTKKRKLSHPRNSDRIDRLPPHFASESGGEEEEEEDNEEDEDETEEKDVDMVAEPEDDDDIEVQEQDLDDDDEEDAADPYDAHFASPDEQATSQCINAIQKDGWETKRAATKTARIFVTQPAGQPDPASSSSFEPMSNIENLKLKLKLRESSAKKMARLDETQQQLAPILFDYQDILFCDRTVKNGDSLRKLVCLHAINHIFKTRDRVIKNNAKLARDSETNPDLEFRDQGFTRPKVLFLLPTRNACLRVVNTIRDLAQPDQQENRKRFDDAFAGDGADADRFGADKPDDFRDLFAGNDDDMFRIGVKFTRKTLKYYSQFYNSDILLASPLGLRMAIGADDGPRNKKSSAKLDYDFLSSVELVVVDHADALLMQNWEHVDFVFEHLNLQPRDAHGCDFSRVRSWYLDDHARFFRQTVVLSAFNTPELAELVRSHCHNWAGKLRIQPSSCPSVITHLGGASVKIRQTFSRFSPASPAADPDARFAYFTSAVLPALARRAADAVGTLIFVPSYLDFVRLRNYLASAAEVETLSFGTLSEYADVPAASRARSFFSAGRHKLLLYTERAHHFRRYKIPGVKRVIFYSLPDNPAFYADIAGSFLAASEAAGTVEPGRGVVRAVFSKFDVLKLERIVGTERVGRMINDRGDTFDFI